MRCSASSHQRQRQTLTEYSDGDQEQGCEFEDIKQCKRCTFNLRAYRRIGNITADRRFRTDSPSASSGTAHATSRNKHVLLASDFPYIARGIAELTTRYLIP